MRVVTTTFVAREKKKTVLGSIPIAVGAIGNPVNDGREFETRQVAYPMTGRVGCQILDMLDMRKAYR